MNRNRWLLLVITLLLVGNFIWHIWMHWGLITIHSKTDPLSKVIHQIEKQGHVTLKTNVDGSMPIHMWVTDVTVADAMATLSAVTEARWRLAYIVAGDKGSISGAVGTLVSGKKLEGWKSVYYPLMMMGKTDDDDDVPVDPRRDPWNVKPAKEPTAQGYLEEAARSVSAAFIFPENWNPPVKSPPKSGPIESSLPALASAAKGKYLEVFLLQRGRRGGNRPERVASDDEDGPRFGGGGDDEGRRRGFGGGQGDAMKERFQAELDKMSAARRAEMEREKADRDAFFASLKDLTQEERMAKIQDMMNQPGMQDKMDNAQASQNNRKSPEQKLARAASYLARKSAATGGAKP